jgi:hypothetical protein
MSHNDSFATAPTITTTSTTASMHILAHTMLVEATRHATITVSSRHRVMLHTMLGAVLMVVVIAAAVAAVAAGNHHTLCSHSDNALVLVL